MSDVTRILAELESGNPAAAERLLPLVYDELRKLAAARLAHEKPGQTLEATALVHEAYLRLVSEPDERVHAAASAAESADEAGELARDGRGQWQSRGHFFAAAAEAMRRILVEAARRKKRRKHGGELVRVPLDDVEIALPEGTEDLEALDEALDRLAAKDPRKAELVKLRYFAGLTQAQAADVLGIGISTADRDWSYARAWLFRELARGADAGNRL